MKTNDIRSELFAIEELISSDSFDIDQETGEMFDNTELLQSLLDEVETAKDEKADGICALIRQAKADEEFIQEEIKRLSERKAMFKRKQDSLKELLDYLLAGQKLKTTRNTIFYRNSTAVEITNEEKIPAEYITVKEVFSFDKKRIKEALADFTEIEGAELKVTKSVQFR